MPSGTKYSAMSDQQKMQANRELDTRKYCYEKSVGNHAPTSVSEAIAQAKELEKYLLDGEADSTD